MDPQSYSVEDILREIQQETLFASSEQKTTPKAEKPPRAVDRFPTAEIPVTGSVKSAPETSSAKHKEPTLRVVTATPKTQDEPAAKPVPQTTRPIGGVPEKKVTHHTVAVSTRTRVLTVASSEEKYHTQEIGASSVEDEQMVLDQFTAESDEELEHELRRRRRTKVDSFRLEKSGNVFKLTGEEEDSEEEELVDAADSEEELEDFEDYSEAETIRSELAYRRRTGAMGVIATGVIMLLLAAMTLLYQFGLLTIFPAALLVSLHMALLVGAVFINHRLMESGAKSFLKFHPNADTPPMLAAVIGIVYTGVQYFHTDAVSNGTAVFMSAVAALALLGGALGRQMQIMRISRNFKFVSVAKNRKLAARYIDDSKIATEMGQIIDEDGFPPTLYYRRADFLTKFLQHSYADDPGDRAMRWYVYIVLGVSLLCAVGYALLNKDTAAKAPMVFASVAMTTLPAWVMFGTQRALSRSCKKALKNNVLISGYAAAETFGGRTDIVVVEARELFPKGQVKLHGIKTFSGTRIDDAITDAAAVAIAAGGPLAPIFRHLIEQRTDILGEVDSLAYEQDMGVSGWVSGRRTLIGNRRLMQNHGVEVPPREYEERYLKEDRNVVYLSTGGELSAMFVVSYLAHPAIKAQVKAMYKEHIRLLVRTVDPNVTAPLIADVMGIPDDGVTMLTAAQGRAYGSLHEPTEDDRDEALLACGGRAESKLFGVVQCRRLRRGGKAAVLSQVISSAVMLLFGVFVSAASGNILRADMMLALSVGYAFFAWLTPKLFRA